MLQIYLNAKLNLLPSQELNIYKYFDLKVSFPFGPICLDVHYRWFYDMHQLLVDIDGKSVDVVFISNQVKWLNLQAL